MRHSMTGFATANGTLDGLRWSWDIRGVNGKGLDLRIRVPDWLEGLEAGVRTAVTRSLSRGNVTVSLRLRDEGAEVAPRLSETHMNLILDAMTRIETEAMGRGLSLAPSTAAQIATMRGILDGGADQGRDPALVANLLVEFDSVLAQFVAMRASEGQALLAVLAGQLDAIDDLVEAATAEADQSRAGQATRMQEALARVSEASETVDPQRIAQELALIAVKSDVTEELDRLRAHVAAARELLERQGPVGRKFDFLTQEFNREANTLCSKASSVGLTRVGLDLKTVIDQMREQVQNVE